MREQTTPVIDFQAYKASDQPLIEKFLKLKEGKSRLTYQAYRRDIQHFQQCFPGKRLKAITFQDLIDFQKRLQRTYALATIHRRIKTVKQLLTYAAKRDYLTLDPDIDDYTLAPLPNLSHEKLLSQEEVDALFKAEQNPRNHAILRFLYYTGVRVSELCCVTWKDMYVCGQGQVSVVVHGKHHKDRTVIFPDFLWRELLHLKTHHYAHTTPYSPVFASKTGRALTRCRVHTIIKGACALAGIDRPVSALWFRHTYGTYSHLGGCSLRVIQEALGHCSLATTGTYVHNPHHDSPGFYLPELS